LCGNDIHRGPGADLEAGFGRLHEGFIGNHRLFKRIDAADPRNDPEVGVAGLALHGAFLPLDFFQRLSIAVFGFVRARDDDPPFEDRYIQLDPDRAQFGIDIPETAAAHHGSVISHDV